MGRSILAVVVGFIVIGALAVGVFDPLVVRLFPGVFDPATHATREAVPLLVMQAGVAISAIFGCWLCARMAPARPMFHALVLGALGLAFNVMSAVMVWSLYPAWYLVLALALVMPYAWVGGWIRERQFAGAGPGTPAMA